MADPADPAQDPQAVGNAFVQQYYSILHKSPELVHKFYQDVSVLGRPGPDGVMTTVTTMKAINDTILSLDYQNYKAEIYSADAQDSYKNGVIVLVTGCLTGEDDLIRKFTQTFFLAPQDRGYYVLNDVFRYLDGKESVGMAINDVYESSATATLTPNHDHAATLEKDSNNGKEVSRSLDNGKVPVVSIADQPVVPAVSIADQPVVPAAEVSSNGKVPVLSTGKEVPVVSAAREVPVVSAADHPVVSSQNAAAYQNVVRPPAETVSSKVQEDAPKKSYASIVHALKGNSAPFRVPPPKPVEQPRAAAAAAPPPQASAPSSNNVLERNNDRIVKDHSVFVGSLPMNATVELLTEIFSQQFGPIKPDGVQVRSGQKGQGMHGKLSCYGFVEFESASSVQRALEVSNLMIGNRRVSIEVKKGSSDGGRFSAGRGGYRNDNFRSRENFNGGRNYGRNEFEKRGEGQARRNGEGNHKVYQNGGGRAARQGQGQGGQGGRKLAAA